MSASWRLPSEGGDEWTGKGMRSSLAGASPMGYKNKVVVAVGPQTAYEIPLAKYPFMQDHYAANFKVYDTLREKYLRHIGQDLIRGRGQLPVDYNAEAHGLRVTSEQKEWLQMQRSAMAVDRAKINDAEFATARYCSKANYDNSVVKTMYFDRDEDKWLPAYAWIQRMFVHQRFPGGPPVVVVEGEWLDLLDDKGPTGLIRVRRNLNSNFNLQCMYHFLEDCEPENVALMAVSPGEDCDLFEVVEKSARNKSR